MMIYDPPTADPDMIAHLELARGAVVQLKHEVVVIRLLGQEPPPPLVYFSKLQG
jgi:hypothetical protein